MAHFSQKCCFVYPAAANDIILFLNIVPVLSMCVVTGKIPERKL